MVVNELDKWIMPSWINCKCFHWCSPLFCRIMPQNFFLQSWRVVMTVRTQKEFCTTWDLKSWCVTLHTVHHIHLKRGYLTVYNFAGGSDQKSLHAGGDRGGGAPGGWRWRGRTLCISKKCWTQYLHPGPSSEPKICLWPWWDRQDGSALWALSYNSVQCRIFPLLYVYVIFWLLNTWCQLFCSLSALRLLNHNVG